MKTPLIKVLTRNLDFATPAVLFGIWQQSILAGAFIYVSFAVAYYYFGNKI